MLDLLLDGLIAHDRPRDDLRKERDVEPHRQHALLRLRPAVIDIEKIREQLERKKGNADGQCDMDGRKILMQQQPQLRGRERQILENEQQAHVEHDARRQNALLLPARRRSFHRAPAGPADRDGKNHEPNEERLSPRIEKQTGHEQAPIAELPAPHERIVIDHQRQRQEQK